MKSLMTICLFVVLGLPAAAAAQPMTPTEAADKGLQIFKETTDAVPLFPKSESGRFLDFVQSFGEGMRGLMGTPISVDNAPAIAQLQEKHGKADRTEERKQSTSPGPPFEAVVYWYGAFGFCVPGADYRDQRAIGKVIYVLWDRRPQK